MKKILKSKTICLLVIFFEVLSVTIGPGKAEALHALQAPVYGQMSSDIDASKVTSNARWNLLQKTKTRKFFKRTALMFFFSLMSTSLFSNTVGLRRFFKEGYSLLFITIVSSGVSFLLGGFLTLILKVVVKRRIGKFIRFGWPVKGILFVLIFLRPLLAGIMKAESLADMISVFIVVIFFYMGFDLVDNHFDDNPPPNKKKKERSKIKFGLSLFPALLKKMEAPSFFARALVLLKNLNTRKMRSRVILTFSLLLTVTLLLANDQIDSDEEGPNKIIRFVVISVVSFFMGYPAVSVTKTILLARYGIPPSFKVRGDLKFIFYALIYIVPYSFFGWPEDILSFLGNSLFFLVGFDLFNRGDDPPNKKKKEKKVKKSKLNLIWKNKMEAPSSLLVILKNLNTQKIKLRTIATFALFLTVNLLLANDQTGSPTSLQEITGFVFISLMNFSMGGLIILGRKMIVMIIYGIPPRYKARSDLKFISYVIIFILPLLYFGWPDNTLNFLAASLFFLAGFDLFNRGDDPPQKKKKKKKVKAKKGGIKFFPNWTWEIAIPEWQGIWDIPIFIFKAMQLKRTLPQPSIANLSNTDNLLGIQAIPYNPLVIKEINTLGLKHLAAA